MTNADVTVLCVDDQNVVRKCVVALIAHERGFHVVAEALTAESALECFAEAKPNVTVISLQTRGCFRAIRAIRRVETDARIVVYATDGVEAVYLALDAGASGFVLKDASAADLISVITKVHGRSGELRDSIKTKLAARYGRPSLTAREMEVLECFAEGLRARDIAATLRVSDHTVRMHMKNIYVKLEVKGRAEALAAALRRGYVRLGAGRQLSSAEPDTNAPESDERVGTDRPRQLTV